MATTRPAFDQEVGRAHELLTPRLRVTGTFTSTEPTRAPTRKQLLHQPARGANGSRGARPIPPRGRGNQTATAISSAKVTTRQASGRSASARTSWLLIAWPA